MIVDGVCRLESKRARIPFRPRHLAAPAPAGGAPFGIHVNWWPMWLRTDPAMVRLASLASDAAYGVRGLVTPFRALLELFR